MAQSRKPSQKSGLRAARREAAIKRRAAQRRNRMVIAGALAAVIVVAILIFANLPDDSDTPEVDFASLPSNGTTLGSESATVHVLEYADFQCRFCAEFATDIVPRLVEDFVEPGDITFSLHLFPILGEGDIDSPGNESAQAAEAALCALDQGEFWPYSHHLFAHHDGVNGGAFSDENLKQFAVDLGLDADEFNACLDTGQHQDQVVELYNSATSAGISSTPTIFINGQSVPYTAQGYTLLKRQIEAAIAGNAIPMS